MNILVLTSQENFVWHSMQEIIPSIEASWLNLNRHGCSVEIANIDNLNLKQLSPKMLGAQKIVITCFNYRMCKMVQYIREVLRLNCGLVFYVHNMATIAFWPYRYFGSSELFQKNDVFITSCENDKTLIRAMFHEPHVYVVPFSRKDEEQNYTAKQNDSISALVYVGRISPQKNLHNLILAYSKLTKLKGSKTPPLILFGREDHLGSPNMNLKNDTYLAFLKSLIEKYDLKDVYFKGHVERNLIDDYLKEKSVLFVSSSLHSDENFGMAVFAALNYQNRVLISDWGGHSDFKKHYPDLVDVLPVSIGEFGPTLSADTILTGFIQSVEKTKMHSGFYQSPYYGVDYLVTTLKESLKHEFVPMPLRFTELANTLYEAKLDFPTSQTQVFSSFSDVNFIRISRFYVGMPFIPLTPVVTQSFFAVPWMDFVDDEFLVSDPHKGFLHFPVDKDGARTKVIVLSSGQKISVPQNTLDRLYKNGFVNSQISFE